MEVDYQLAVAMQKSEAHAASDDGTSTAAAQGALGMPQCSPLATHGLLCAASDGVSNVVASS